MSETRLNITIYTKPECKESNQVVTDFLVNEIPFAIKDISDPEAYVALDSLMKSVSIPKKVVTPTVVAECSCGKHVEWWSGYNDVRRNRLFGMIKHLDDMNSGRAAIAE